MRRATDAQISYLEDLLTGRGFDTRLKRNDWMSNRAGREVKYLEELTVKEASELIEELVEGA